MSRRGRRNWSNLEINKRICKQLILHRIWNKLSQSNLAEDIGTTFQQYQKVERCYNRIFAEQLISICNNRKWDISIFNNIIGLKLRQKRLELKLSQSKVGSMLNVTFQQIQKYETGLNGISLNNLWKFCILNNLDINWFFEDIRDWETTNVIRKEE